MTKQTPPSRDLPPNLYRDGIYFSYRRPDNERRVGMGKDKEAAVGLAISLNHMFGVGELGSTHGARGLYRQTAHQRLDSATLPDWLKARLPDLFPTEHEQAASKAWARSSHETRFRGNQFIRIQEAHEGRLPDWAVALYRQTRKNALVRKIEFNLCEQDLIDIILRSQGRCEVTGVRLRLDEVSMPGKRGRRPWAPSIDRTDSVGGYEASNCRIVCVAANLAMGMWGEEVLLTLAKGLARRHLAKADM